MTASETWSATLSGWPMETDSDVKRLGDMEAGGGSAGPGTALRGRWGAEVASRGSGV